MKQLLLYDLYVEWNKTEGLTKLGVEDYLLFLKLITEDVAIIKTFDDFVFICETIWLKSWEQQVAFHQLFEKRRAGIGEMIAFINRKKEIEKVIPPTDERNDITPVKQTTTDVRRNAKESPDVKEDSPKNDTQSKTELPEKEPEGIVPIYLGTDKKEGEGNDETQMYSFTVKDEVLSASRHYLFGTEYFPVSSRVLQQTWRRLYNLRKGDTLGEISIPATIQKISREGQFHDFVYRPEDVNMLSLFIFIDLGGSMAAMDAFGVELARTALESEVHTMVKPYFFYNVPHPSADDEQVYVVYDLQRTESFTTAKLFKGLKKKNIALMLYSDCGVPNGEINSDRLAATKKFLKRVLKFAGFVAWLNPTPEHRWGGTAAGQIRLHLPEVGMFEADPLGITQAVNALKGKWTSNLKKQHAAAARRK